MDGALGGLLGTAAMSAGMLAAGKLGLMGEQPPEIITAGVLDAAGVRPDDERARDALASVAHFAFGVAGGSVFAVLHRRLGLPIPAAAHGLIYASLVWSVSYLGWVPALRLMPSAQRDRPDRPLVMILAHWLYGSVLGAVVGLRGRSAPVG